jgi:hypothetical protein
MIWKLAIIAVTAALAACNPPTGGTAEKSPPTVETPNDFPRYYGHVAVFRDPITGCEYLLTMPGSALTPRIGGWQNGVGTYIRGCTK